MEWHLNLIMKFIISYQVILVTPTLHLLSHLWIANNIDLIFVVVPSVICQQKGETVLSHLQMFYHLEQYICVHEFFFKDFNSINICLPEDLVYADAS